MEASVKETLELLAYLYLAHSKYEKALRLLLALNELDPEDPEIKRLLSFAYLKNHRYQAALHLIEKTLEPTSSSEMIISSNLIKAKALWALGKEKAARHTFNHLDKIEL